MDFIRDYLTKQGMTSEEQNTVLALLDEAISLNFIVQLDDKLPAAERDELRKRHPEKVEELMDVFRERFSEAELQQALVSAAEAVLHEFTAKSGA